jgi:hypothetical protein
MKGFMRGGLKWVGFERVLACFSVLPTYLPGRTEESHENDVQGSRCRMHVI